MPLLLHPKPTSAATVSFHLSALAIHLWNHASQNRRHFLAFFATAPVAVRSESEARTPSLFNLGSLKALRCGDPAGLHAKQQYHGDIETARTGQTLQRRATQE